MLPGAPALDPRRSSWCEGGGAYAMASLAMASLDGRVESCRGGFLLDRWVRGRRAADFDLLVAVGAIGTESSREGLSSADCGVEVEKTTRSGEIEETTRTLGTGGAGSDELRSGECSSARGGCG